MFRRLNHWAAIAVTLLLMAAIGAPMQRQDTWNVLAYGASCDGSTDDTTVINSILTRAAGHGTVVIPATTGSSCIVGQLNLPSNTLLQVDATLFLKPGNFQAVLQPVANASNVNVWGSGTLDGNKANQTGTSSGFQTSVGTSTNIRLTGLTITDVKTFPLAINQTNGAWVSYVKISNSGNAPGFAVNCVGCWADHITVTSITADYGWAFYGGVSNSGITNSDISGSGAGGIVVLNDSSQAAICHDILIEGNIVHGNTSNGIEVSFGPTGGNGDNQNVTIIGNRVFGNNTGNGTGHSDISLTGISVSNVMGNTIGPSGSGSNGMTGIGMAAASNTILVSGNTIFNEGQGGTNGVGISVGGAVQLVLANNNCFDNQGTMTMAFCVNGTWGANSTMVNNNLGPSIGNADNSTYLSTTVVAQSPRFAKPFTVFPTLVVVPVAFAALPTCNATYKGGHAMITDASTTTPAFFAVAVGGGTTVAPVECNGANWIYG